MKRFLLAVLLALVAGPVMAQCTGATGTAALSVATEINGVEFDNSVAFDSLAVNDNGLFNLDTGRLCGFNENNYLVRLRVPFTGPGNYEGVAMFKLYPALGGGPVDVDGEEVFNLKGARGQYFTVAVVKMQAGDCLGVVVDRLAGPGSVVTDAGKARLSMTCLE